MTGLDRNIDLIIFTSGIVLCTMSSIQAACNRFIKKETKIFFVLFFCIMDLYLACLFLRAMTNGLTGLGWATLSRGIFFSQAILSSLLTVMVTALMLHQSGETDWRSSRAFRISCGIWLIYVAMQLGNLFTGFLYTVDDGNSYSRAPLFALQMIPPFMIMMLNLWLLRKKKDELDKRQIKAFITYITVPTLCMLVQIVFFGINLIAMGTIIAAISMFSYIVADQLERIQIKEAENAQLKIDILMAQIRPHFLINSLTTIKYLIAYDANKADEAMTAIIKYLRHNLDSLMTDRMSPFKDELEHVKAYLELQMLRFGDELRVEYELESMDFSIPSLTLLPLVENAVSYGVRRNEDRTGCVTIRSRREDDRIEVCVEDNGPGFVPETLPDDEDRSRIGMQNVRERIERVSDGKLIIYSKMGEGTKATIVLPK